MCAAPDPAAGTPAPESTRDGEATWRTLGLSKSVSCSGPTLRQVYGKKDAEMDYGG